jgi:hypothetical protein
LTNEDLTASDQLIIEEEKIDKDDDTIGFKRE